MDRNQEVRDRYNNITSEFGIKHVWISEVTGISYNTLNSWKAGKSRIGKDKLLLIENVLDRYNDFWV